MGPDPKDMALMAEADALLDALEERIPEDEELRDGLADLLFYGPLAEEFTEEFNQVIEENQSPPKWRQHP